MSTDNPAPAGDDNPQGSAEQPPAQGSAQGTNTKPTSPPDEATRKLQSERDKLRADIEEKDKRLADLEATVYGNQAKQTIADFIKENKAKYPDVDVDDLLTAESVDDLDRVAKKAQGKFDRIRNNALSDLRNVPEETMTEEERDKALKEAEEETAKDGRSTFQKFLSIKQTKIRK